MSTSDFQKVNVKDDRIANITDSIKYAVMTGGQSVTPAQFVAISESTSSHTFNIQCPSENTLLDRRTLWDSTAKIQLKIRNNTGIAQNNKDLIGYGNSGAPMVNASGASAGQAVSALSPFPLHQMCTTMTATINNTSVSINIRDVLPFILRFNDRRELAKYNSMTPTAFDTYQNYTDAIGAINNPNGSWGNAADNDLVPRGAFPVKFFGADGETPLVMSGVGGQTAQGVDLITVVEFHSVEPLLLSPFMFADPRYNNQAFYGITNMNLVFNIGSLNRVYRTNLKTYAAGGDVPANSAGFVGAPTFFKNGFSGSKLHFTFLTPHSSDLLPSRNVVSYYNLPRYTTKTPDIAIDAPATVISQSLQLNQISDKLIIAVRKTMGQQQNNDADCYLPISGLSIQFNNNAGILSSATAYELFDMSVKNGSNQTWYEFSGEAYSSSVTATDGVVKTSGSIVVLEFGKDIQLTESYYAPGSLGNFNLQVNVNVKNNTNVAINNTNPYELVLITMESGVFVNERGTSQVFTGILTKQDVLEAVSGPAYSRSDVQRYVGSGFFDTLKTIASSVKDAIAPVASVLGPVAKGVLGAMPDPRAQMASKALGALGMGQSGGRKDARLM